MMWLMDLEWSCTFTLSPALFPTFFPPFFPFLLLPSIHPSLSSLRHVRPSALLWWCHRGICAASAPSLRSFSVGPGGVNGRSEAPHHGCHSEHQMSFTCYSKMLQTRVLDPRVTAAVSHGFFKEIITHLQSCCRCRAAIICSRDRK